MNEVFERPPLVIPPGSYQLRYVGYQTRSIYMTGKLYAYFKVLDFGPYFDTVLVRHYSCNLKGRPKKNGKFEAGWRSKLMQEYVAIIGKRPDRKDRITMSRLRDRVILGTVATVEKASDQTPIPADLQYSVITSLAPFSDPTPLPTPSPIPTPT